MRFDEDGFYVPQEPEPLTNQLRGKVISLSDIKAMVPPVPLNDVLYFDTLAWLAGPPGSYKSFLAVDWACDAARRGLRVLYVAAEGVAGMGRRVEAWEAANGPLGGSEGNLRFLPQAVDVVGRGWSDLEEVVGEGKPKLIVLDTQARMTPGLEENSATDVGRYVEGCDRLRRASGACVLTLHHSSKGQAYLRGSSALMGAADTVVALSRPEEMQRVVGVRNVKQKDSEQRPEYWLRPADQVNGSMTLIQCERPEWWPKS